MRQIGSAAIMVAVGLSACSSSTTGSGSGSCFLGVCGEGDGSPQGSSSGASSSSSSGGPTPVGGSSSGASSSGGPTPVGGSSSGGGSASASVVGTIDGYPIPVVDAVALTSTSYVPPGGSTPVHVVRILVTNQTAICSILERAGNPASASLLSIEIESVSAIVPGTYVPNTTGSTVSAASGSEYTVDDSTCTYLTETLAQTGTVTLTSVTSAAIAGTFTFTYDTGDALRGTFDVPVCTADMTALETATTACGH